MRYHSTEEPFANPFWRACGVIMLTIVVAFLILSCCGCYSIKKAEWQLEKAHTLRPATAAKKCSLWYPVIDSATGSITYLPGRTDTIPGPTVFVDCDSFYKSQQTGGNYVQKPLLKYVGVNCPPSTHTTDTIRVDSSHYRTSTAKVEYVSYQRDSLGKEYDRKADKVESLSKSRNTWMWIALGLAGYSLVRLWLRLQFRIALP